jgi:predicted acetylornithine/succinylornithine family transaminase
MDTYLSWPVELVEGSGATVTDSEGRTYIDLVAGIAVASVGHSHPSVVDAIAEQARRLMHTSNLYPTSPALVLAEKLHALTGMRSFFCNSGAEAIEAALKLVRRWTQREKGRSATIACTTGSFHGRTFGALAATGQESKQVPFVPMLEGFVHVPFGEVDALAQAGSFDAFLVEPIQGESGIVIPDEKYLSEVRALCDERGALLVLDEVQTGLGRTGRWFAHEWSGVKPDVMCLAKALGGGLPIGACLARPGVASAFQPGDHGTTFGGGPIQAAAANAVLEVIEREGLVERAGRLGTFLLSELTSAFGAVATVRGRGLMLAIEFEAPVARALAASAFERGVLVNDIGTSILRLTPPLVIDEDQLRRAVSILREAWDETRAAA